MGGSSEYAAQQQELAQWQKTVDKLETVLEDVYDLLVQGRTGDAMKRIKSVVYIEGVDYSREPNDVNF